MAPSKWDDESGDESTPPTSPPPIARRGKFDDEDEDSDVLESWDAAEDSEVEREKAKKAAEVKAKAEEAAKLSKKTKTQRIEEHKASMAKRQAELDDLSSDEDEDEATRRARMRAMELDTDLAHAEDLFGDLAVVQPKRAAVKPVTLTDPSDPGTSIDLSSLPIFNPNTKDQFLKLREALVPLLAANSKKGQYTLFMQEFTKQICKDLPSDQVKKIASGLTTLSNEKMKEEKLAEKGGKKTKAAKGKVMLKASRDVSTRADTSVYDDDGLGDDDFM
ncbi:translation initiation factor eIF3 subunit [Tothia fuscella]|uniref:Eukaryotic translation initiation factor 3 subunit J n=1 Tax=Tothia fuscella TaxID=1048955 RepID=A0A9P4NR28_9PEZI|nr:translation initiation factor eIF3 subunit [Tothia fuscella]